MSLRDELRTQWGTGGMVVRLILINVAVFLALRLIDLPFALADRLGPDIQRWLKSTSDLSQLVRTPWTVVTYMFTHWAPLHIFFNMLMLWFSGRLFEDLLGGKRLLGNYLLGGVAGLALYIACYNLFPAFARFTAGSTILGASAAVMAVFVGIASYTPDMVVNLLFFGPVRLKYVALIYVVLDLVSVGQGVNSGGHIAHLGGALYGFLAARQLRQGRDWSMALANGIDPIAGMFGPRSTKLRMEKRPRHKVRVLQDDDYNATKQARQARIDAILDKIGRSGYDSLSKEERDILFRASHEK